MLRAQGEASRGRSRPAKLPTSVRAQSFVHWARSRPGHPVSCSPAIHLLIRNRRYPVIGQDVKRPVVNYNQSQTGPSTVRNSALHDTMRVRARPSLHRGQRPRAASRRIILRRSATSFAGSLPSQPGLLIRASPVVRSPIATPRQSSGSLHGHATAHHVEPARYLSRTTAHDSPNVRFYRRDADCQSARMRRLCSISMAGSIGAPRAGGTSRGSHQRGASACPVVSPAAMPCTTRLQDYAR